MKKIKMLVATAIFCTACFAGYAAYDKATMTDEEKSMLANIDVLTKDENPTYNCTGPKHWFTAVCQCTNTTKCTDNNGCN